MRGNEIEALTEGRRRRREKLDPALNSIEGERSQFGLAAGSSSSGLGPRSASCPGSLLGWTDVGVGVGVGLLKASDICSMARRAGKRQQMSDRLASDPVREMAEQIWASEIRRRVQTLKKEQFELS